MTIQNLRYIIEIARCHSISKAAKSLFMTQSAISNAVKETEADASGRLCAHVSMDRPHCIRQDPCDESGCGSGSESELSE